MKEITLEEWLKVNEAIIAMVDTMSKIITGKTIGSTSIESFQKLVLIEQVKDLHGFLVVDKQ